MTRISVLGTAANETNPRLVAAWRAGGLDCTLADPGVIDHRGLAADVVLGRLDVLPTLDGVEPGLLALLLLERRGGVRVLNTAEALLTTHDKLRTAAVLARSGVPHPRTAHLRRADARALPRPPVVLKPRFGSWGRDVRLCETPAEVADCIGEFATRSWFRRHGVLVQEPIRSPGYDLRLVVAGGRVVGAIERHPRAGEWRTNVSVGARKRPVVPGADACAVAVAAAEAAGTDLVGVDLLPRDGAYTVLELNGAVDFDCEYRSDADVYAATAEALGLARPTAIR